MTIAIKRFPPGKLIPGSLPVFILVDGHAGTSVPQFQIPKGQAIVFTQTVWAQGTTFISSANSRKSKFPDTTKGQFHKEIFLRLAGSGMMNKIFSS